MTFVTLPRPDGIPGLAGHMFRHRSGGRRKALALSARRGVSIDYHTGSKADVAFEKASFDAVALVNTHFPAAVSVMSSERSGRSVRLRLIRTGGIGPGLPRSQDTLLNL